jgi:hypothetical protein
VTNSVTVILAPITTGADAGTGSFGYTITLPAGVDTATLTLASIVPDYTSGDLDLKTTNSDTITALPAGYYLVSVVLSKPGEIATKTEVVHIYKDNTTTASYNLSSIAFVPLPPPPSAPAAPTVTPSFNQLSVSWPAVTGANGYEVYYHTSNDSGSAIDTDVDIDGVTATITNLADSQQYYVWVKAKNEGGVSGFSPGGTAKTSDPLPAVFVTGGEAEWMNWFGDGYLFVDYGSGEFNDERYEIGYIGWDGSTGGEDSFGFMGFITYVVQFTPTEGVIILEYHDDDDFKPLGAWDFANTPAGNFQAVYYDDLQMTGGTGSGPQASMGQANGYSAGGDNNEETETLNEAISKFGSLADRDDHYTAGMGIYYELQ